MSQKKLWQHKDTGRAVCSETWPSDPDLYTEITPCEHGMYGCVMDGDHMPEECHSAEMIETYYAAREEAECN